MNISSNISANGAGAAAGMANAPVAQPPAQPVASPAPSLEPAAPHIVTREQLDAAVDRANVAMRGNDDGVRFAVHEGTNRIVVRIVDPKSMEIIREFPDSHFLDMMAKLQELAGMQVDVQL